MGFWKGLTWGSLIMNGGRGQPPVNFKKMRGGFQNL